MFQAFIDFLCFVIIWVWHLWLDIDGFIWILLAKFFEPENQPEPNWSSSLAPETKGLAYHGHPEVFTMETNDEVINSSRRRE